MFQPLFFMLLVTGQMTSEMLRSTQFSMAQLGAMLLSFHFRSHYFGYDSIQMM